MEIKLEVKIIIKQRPKSTSKMDVFIILGDELWGGLITKDGFNPSSVFQDFVWNEDDLRKIQETIKSLRK